MITETRRRSAATGLLQREEREHLSVELEVDRVDLVVARDHGVGRVVVVLHDGLHGPLHGVAGQLPQREQPQLPLLQLLVEVRPGHQPNLPVT
jgi:hypothetical protein